MASSMPPTVRFLPASAPHFLAEVKKRVYEELQRSHIQPHADWRMYLKTAIVLCLFAGSYCVYLLADLSLLSRLLAAALFGFSVALIGFNISHDALHGAYSANSKVNKCLGYSFDMIGASSFVWRVTHNLRHHVYTNIPGYDQDIDKAILLRLSPADPLYSFHRYQHLYAPVLYCLLGFNWILYTDYKWLWEERFCCKPSIGDFFALFLFKLFNAALTLILPFVFLPWQHALLGCFVMYVVGGFSLALIFQLSHVVDNVDYGWPDEQGTIQSQWALHEMMTTSNFACQSYTLSWLVGGLNFQIEHHLFPHFCHSHYRHIAPIVQKVAREMSVPYHFHATFFQALRSHFRHLKNLGRYEIPPAGSCNNNL